MIRNVMLLTRNDLAIAYQNKTLYLILFIPLFVFLVLQLVEEGERDVQTINIGLLETATYPPGMVQGLTSAEQVFRVSWLPNEAAGKRWLRERDGHGILVPNGVAAEDYALIVLDKASLQTVIIVESVTGLQRALEGRSGDWIVEIRALQDNGLQRQMLPTWILMLVLMVGFIVLPAQVAEEKEKKLLLGLLQTPIREVEWLLAKVTFGTISIVMAALLLHVLTSFDISPGGGLSYLAFLIAGGFCFSAFGVFVGFLCRTQASARTLGVLFYLPLLLPSALADYSKVLSGVAPFLPSYQLYRPIKSILLEGSSVADFPLDLFALLGVGLITSILSYQLMKKRWLM